jgi:hypothetical protein
MDYNNTGGVCKATWKGNLYGNLWFFVDFYHSGCHDLVPSWRFPQNPWSYEACGNSSHGTLECSIRPAYPVLYRAGGYWMFEEMFNGGRALTSRWEDEPTPPDFGIWRRWKMKTMGNVSISISSIDKESLCNKVSVSDFDITVLISLIFILIVTSGSIVIAVLLKRGKLQMNQRLKNMRMRIVLMIMVSEGTSKNCFNS